MALLFESVLNKSRTWYRRELASHATAVLEYLRKLAIDRPRACQGLLLSACKSQVVVRETGNSQRHEIVAVL